MIGTGIAIQAAAIAVTIVVIWASVVVLAAVAFRTAVMSTRPATLLAVLTRAESSVSLRVWVDVCQQE